MSFGLPAPKSLGELADAEPVNVIDTPEQEPLAFERLCSFRSSRQARRRGFASNALG